MYGTIIIIAIGIICFSAGVFSACNSQGNNLSNTDQIRFDLKKTILITESDDDDAYMFTDVKHINLNSKNNIYLIDDLRVAKYDNTGKYLCTIGGKGQGPGEYISPKYLFIDDNNSLFILDSGRSIISYNLNGIFIKKIQLEFGIVGNFFVDELGNIYGISRQYTNEGVIKSLCKFSDQGKIISTYAKHQEIDVNVKSSGGGGVLSGIKHPHSADAFFFPILGKVLCFGVNLYYDFKLFDLDGNIQLEFGRKLKSLSISKTIKEYKKRFGDSTIRRFIFPNTTPFYSGILADDKGYIYVLRTKSILAKDKKVALDIFSSDGNFIGTTQLSNMPSVIRENAMYVIDKDELGRSSIQKWIIVNSDFQYK